MSEETAVESNPAAVKGNPSLRPETNDSIASMADAFKAAMSDDPAPPAEVPAEVPAEAPVEVVAETAEEAKESRSSKDFKLIKQERDEAKARIDELTSKVSELEESTSTTDKYEKLKSEYDEMSKVLSVSNLEKHPKFREQFTKPIEAQVERAQAYVAEEDRSQLSKIL